MSSASYFTRTVRDTLLSLGLASLLGLQNYENKGKGRELNEIGNWKLGIGNVTQGYFGSDVHVYGLALEGL